MYFCAMKVGISICTCGTAEKILNGRRLTMHRGMLHIISPLIPCVELTQSEDYADLSLTDAPDQLIDVMYPYLSHLAERNMPIFPAIELPQERCCYYESNIRDILSQQADGRPEWSDHCTQCLACFHICPVNAIQYGKFTKEKKQYRISSYVSETPTSSL